MLLCELTSAVVSSIDNFVIYDLDNGKKYWGIGTDDPSLLPLMTRVVLATYFDYTFDVIDVYVAGDDYQVPKLDRRFCYKNHRRDRWRWSARSKMDKEAKAYRRKRNAKLRKKKKEIEKPEKTSGWDEIL